MIVSRSDANELLVKEIKACINILTQQKAIVLDSMNSSHHRFAFYRLLLGFLGTIGALVQTGEVFRIAGAVKKQRQNKIQTDLQQQLSSLVTSETNKKLEVEAYKDRLDNLKVILMPLQNQIDSALFTLNEHAINRNSNCGSWDINGTKGNWRTEFPKANNLCDIPKFNKPHPLAYCVQPILQYCDATAKIYSSEWLTEYKGINHAIAQDENSINLIENQMRDVQKNISNVNVTSPEMYIAGILGVNCMIAIVFFIALSAKTYQDAKECKKSYDIKSKLTCINDEIITQRLNALMLLFNISYDKEMTVDALLKVFNTKLNELQPRQTSFFTLFSAPPLPKEATAACRPDNNGLNIKMFS